jgi:hypothetical protein
MDTSFHNIIIIIIIITIMLRVLGLKKEGKLHEPWF